MSLLTPDITQAVERSVLCWLATVSPDGQPNVSPKEIWAVFDAAHIVVANIASPTSVRNVATCEKVCVSFVDVFVQKGFKVLGRARNLTPRDAAFAAWVEPLARKAGPRFPIHSVIVVEASAIEPLVAPSYRLYPGETTAHNQVVAAHRAYGVGPAA